MKLTNLMIRNMGEKEQWQCTPRDVYGQVTAATRLEEGDDSDNYPANVHTVLLSDLPMHTSIAHLVHLAAVFVEEQPATSNKATAPASNLLMADQHQSVRVAVWKDHATQLQGAQLNATKRNTTLY